MTCNLFPKIVKTFMQKKSIIHFIHSIERVFNFNGISNKIKFYFKQET